MFSRTNFIPTVVQHVEMNLKLISFLLIISLFSSCEKSEDNRSAILLDSSYNKWLKSEYGYEAWNPEKVDFEVLDKILKTAIKENQFNFYKEPVFENINNYSYKQYVPYVDGNGNRIILLNTFCEIPEMHMEIDGSYELKEAEWKTDFIDVNDGGPCYWRITINVDKMEYSELMVNGV